MKNGLFFLWVLVQVLVSATPVEADDTDIYTRDGVKGCDELALESSVFVAAAVSANSAVPVGSPKDIYFAMFQPKGKPGWSGNVKKLKLLEYEAPDPNSGGTVTRQIIVQAPLTEPPRAAMSGDGRLRPDALTFWTDPEGRDVLTHNPDRGEAPGADGRSVERGGAGQQIPGYLTNTVGASNLEAGSRQLFTEDPGPGGGLLALDSGMAGLSALSEYLDPNDLLDEAGERALIRWVRGQDAFDVDDDDNRLESRAWLMGDVVHSRPLVVNYGARPGTGYSAGNPDTRLFFGANDGIFRSLQNTRDDAAASESGRETWAFIPLELLGMQSVLAGIPPDAGPSHLYGMDGEAVAYVEDLDNDGNIEIADGDKVWVYIGQRRGGRSIYAFDMSDPDAPELKWKITAEQPGFEQLAMTFSTPRIAQLDYNNGIAGPALIFGGGYNGGWSAGVRTGKDAGSESDTIGNAVYVVDADSGELVWRAAGPGTGRPAENSDQLYTSTDMKHGIASPLTVLDSDHNGLSDRAYVGDTGGNVLRVELTEYGKRETGSNPTGEENWYVHTLARLGGAADRRFFHAPDYVKTRDGSGDYDGVVITSGNRASPLDASVQNFAYLIKDRATAPYSSMGGASPPEALTHDDLVDITRLCVAGNEAVCSAAGLDHGWRLSLGDPGEKGLSSPVVSNGTAFFTTYLPPSGDCLSVEGSSRIYAVALGNGAVRLSPGGILQPQHRHRPIGSGMQGDVLPLPDGVLVPGKGVEGRQVFDSSGRLVWRVYWFEQGVDPL